MSKLPTSFVIAFIAIGILVAATTATVMSAGVKPFNLALAQLRFPLQTQPQVRAPIQQQPTGPATAAAVSPSSSGATWGPNCVGCVSTQNLANGAATTQKIAPGAIQLRVIKVIGTGVTIQPGDENSAVATCPSGSFATGGGFDSNGIGERPLILSSSSEQDPAGNQVGWGVTAFNNGLQELNIFPIVNCASINP